MNLHKQTSSSTSIDLFLAPKPLPVARVNRSCYDMVHWLRPDDDDDDTLEWQENKTSYLKTVSKRIRSSWYCLTIGIRSFCKISISPNWRRKTHSSLSCLRNLIKSLTVSISRTNQTQLSTTKEQFPNFR